MMKLKDIYNKKTVDPTQERPYATNMPVISFETFPPKGEGEAYEKSVNNLFNELKILKQFNPAFISVTYGAGGSTQEKTFDIVLKIKQELEITPMPHFTCVNSDRTKILEYIKKVEQAGIKNILALRGDPPKGTEHFQKTVDGFEYANELVSFIKEQTDLSIAVAGYPEKHPQAQTIEKDIENLKRKVDGGADVIITQLFFDNADYFNFLTRVERAGIKIPVIPGIMPITSVSQIERITSMCGAKIPKVLQERITKHQNDPQAIIDLGIDFAIYQTSQLIDFGVKGLHFYPLNKSFAVKEILENILVETKI